MAVDSGYEVKIPFDKNIAVASNEMFLRATINRNLEKLLKNDLVLARIIEHYGTGSEFSIQIYKETRVYAKGDVVIYPEYNRDMTDILNVYLLQSIIDNNANEPAYEVVDKFIRNFQASGWEEINPLFSIYNSNVSKSDISSFLEYTVGDKFHLSHELNLEYHKFGELSSVESLSAKLLLNDMSNISDSRDDLFWPYETGSVEAGNYTGTYKKWGNGILEYDLTFCLGDSVEVEKTIDNSGNIKATPYLKANSFIPISSSAFNNDDYFLNAESYRIFNKVGTSDKYNVNGIAQTNINKQVNTYSGTLRFPIPFADNNYMIFTSSTTGDKQGRSQSPNTFAFANRTKEFVTAVYVIPNYNGVEDLSEVILKNNVFQCQIMGRWK